MQREGGEERGAQSCQHGGPRPRALQEPYLGLHLAASLHRWGGGLVGMTRADAAGEGGGGQGWTSPGPPALPAPSLFVVTARFNPLFILGIEALVSYFLKERM